MAVSGITAVAATIVTAPASSQAAVMVGGDASGVAYDAGFGCTFDPADTCTHAQIAGGTAAPFDGVVVGWRIVGDSLGSAFTLRVIRPLGGGSYTGAGTSAPEVVAPNIVNSFPTRLPIQTGDVIGVNVPGAPGDPGSVRAIAVGPGALAGNWLAALADGEAPGRAPTFTTPQALLRLDATVEPDCDGDGLGDESQDQDVSACPPGPTVTITSGPEDRVKTKKKRAKATFAFSASEPGATFSCALDGKQEFKECSSQRRYCSERRLEGQEEEGGIVFGPPRQQEETG